MSQAIIESALEQLIETGGDLGQDCFARFFERSEEGRGLMEHMDDVHRGKMMAEIYRLLLTPDLSTETDYLNWESKNHQTAYFVPKSLYPVFMDALIESISASLGADWTQTVAEAFQVQCDRIVQEIQTRYSA
jgi:hypothetical protein